MCKGNAAGSATMFETQSAPRYTPNRHGKHGTAGRSTKPGNEVACVDTGRAQLKILRAFKTGVICFHAALKLAEVTQCLRSNCPCQHVSSADLSLKFWEMYSLITDKAPCPFHKLGQCWFGESCEDAHDAPKGNHGDGQIQTLICIASVGHHCLCPTSMRFPHETIPTQYTELHKILNDLCPIGSRSPPAQKKRGATNATAEARRPILADHMKSQFQHHHCAAPVYRAPSPVPANEEEIAPQCEDLCKLLSPPSPTSTWVHNPYGPEWFDDITNKSDAL